MGTPGYLAPDMLKVSVEDDATGYGKEIDLWVPPSLLPSPCSRDVHTCALHVCPLLYRWACGVIMYTFKLSWQHGL